MSENINQDAEIKEEVNNTELEQNQEPVKKTEAEKEASASQSTVKVISPGRMVLKRFFRSKLSIVSLSFLVFLFLFSFLGPFLTQWGESEPDPRPGAPVVMQIRHTSRTRVDEAESIELLLIQMLEGHIADTTINNARAALTDHTFTGDRAAARAALNNRDNIILLASLYGINSPAGAQLSANGTRAPAYGGIFLHANPIPGEPAIVTPFTVGTNNQIYVGALDMDYGDHGRVVIVERTQIRHSNNPRERNINARPSIGQPLGTDSSGYDILTRLMYGGRISLTLGFVSVAISLSLGLLFGGLAGYFGKWVDNLVMRVVDILSCLPGLPVLLIFSAILDGMPQIPVHMRIYVVMGMLAFISWHGTTRVVRGQILTLREQEFMVATEALGLPVSRRILKHLIPNVMPLIIVGAVTALGSMILTEASLSFLGLGVRPPAAAWGLMIASVRDPQVMIQYPNQWIPAGVLIVMAVLAFGFLGDSLRDAFDPKAKR